MESPGMRFLVALATVATTLVATPSSCHPDLQTLENEQKLLLDNIQQSKIASAKLKDQLDQLQQSNIANSNTLNVSNVVVDNNEDDSSKPTATVNYTAPIIVLLPEKSTDREKWEYALTLRCLGQKNFTAFDEVHNSKLMEMSTIKGKTVKDIQHEIKETEKQLKETKAELASLQSALPGLKDTSYGDRTKKLHIMHNIKLVKHEIDILDTKLERLQKRLKAAVLFSSSSAETNADKPKKKGDDEDEEEENEEGGNDEGEDDTPLDEGDESEDSLEVDENDF